jgi:hypothetical protein
MKEFSAGLLLPVFTAVAQAGVNNYPIGFQPITSVTSDSLHNVHITYGNRAFAGKMDMIYGDCDLKHPRQLHHLVGRTEIDAVARPTRFVWIVPEDAKSGGCLHAFSGDKLVGRSQPITVRTPLRKRQSIADVADIDGPWFDGVAYMKSKNNSDTFVAEAKNKCEHECKDFRNEELTCC